LRLAAGIRVAGVPGGEEVDRRIELVRLERSAIRRHVMTTVQDAPGELLAGER
jgi:hypothetical protein